MTVGRPPEEYANQFDVVLNVSGKLGIDLVRYHIDRHHWVRFNQLRDEGKDFEFIMVHTEIHEPAANHLLEGLRKCILKWHPDEEKVRECMDAKIDP